MSGRDNLPPPRANDGYNQPHEAAGCRENGQEPQGDSKPADFVAIWAAFRRAWEGW